METTVVVEAIDVCYPRLEVKRTTARVTLPAMLVRRHGLQAGDLVELIVRGKYVPHPSVVPSEHHGSPNRIEG